MRESIAFFVVVFSVLSDYLLVYVLKYFVLKHSGVNYIMVMSYYGQAMYRQQQIAPPNGHFQANAPWYAGYHQSPAPATTYCVQEEQQMQQMWHHHSAHSHGVFQHEFQEFLHAGIPGLPPQHQVDGESLHSPTITGSDMSSPGAQSGNITPPQQNVVRPPQARSPFEWIKKNSYQSQPNPGENFR